MFHLIYGHSYFVGVEMLWRFVVYLMIVNTAFLFTLIQNRVGKVAFILGCLTIGLALVVLLPSINMALDGAIADAVFPFLAKLMGFDGGAVHMAYPILTFLAVTAAVSLASYLMLRRAELK